MIMFLVIKGSTKPTCCRALSRAAVHRRVLPHPAAARPVPSRPRAPPRPARRAAPRRSPPCPAGHQRARRRAAPVLAGSALPHPALARPAPCVRPALLPAMPRRVLRRAAPVPRCPFAPCPAALLCPAMPLWPDYCTAPADAMKASSRRTHGSPLNGSGKQEPGSY